MSSVLAEIIRGVREDEALRRLTAAQLAEQIEIAPAPLDVLATLKSRPFSVIAEVKRSSPSKGALAQIADPAALAKTYRDNGASVVSVLTEGRRFNGSIDDFKAVRNAIDIPILRKDFMVSEYLIRESRAIGADLILLIVAALDDVQLKDFHHLATELGMCALVEVHDREELERALAIGPAIIGVNARDLKTLSVSASAFAELIPAIPSELYRVAESGIGNFDEAKFARECGADAILVGEALVRSPDAGSTLREFLSLN